MTSSIETAQRGELPRIHELLEEADLPVAGVDHAESFLVAREQERLVGCIGLEVYGDVALLRSLAVRPETRGSGLGKLLVERLLETASARGVSVMYLLTTTAAEYFPRFGFEPIPREQADPRLQASEEFRGACPDSAVCMRLRV
jgi:amino-acid N-acetyltransferase